MKYKNFIIIPQSKVPEINIILPELSQMKRKRDIHTRKIKGTSPTWILMGQG